MSKVCTARELWAKYREADPDYANPDAFKMMIEFAKLHVKAALEAAADKAFISEGTGWNGRDSDIVDKDSILNAYPLENIK